MSERHYGLKLNDKVEIEDITGNKLQGIVHKFDLTDNNRCYLKFRSGHILTATCEECKKLK